MKLTPEERLWKTLDMLAFAIAGFGDIKWEIKSREIERELRDDEARSEEPQ